MNDYLKKTTTAASNSHEKANIFRNLSLLQTLSSSLYNARTTTTTSTIKPFNNLTNILDGNYLFNCSGSSNSVYCASIENAENQMKHQLMGDSDDNDDDEFNAYLKFRFVMSWISLVIILIGLVGNLISFIVLINPKMRISTNVFLSSLCVSGFVALVGLLINSVIYELVAYYAMMRALTVIFFLYPYIYPLITTFQMYSILLTVCVSVNQFIYIYFSKGKTQQTKQSNEKECKKASKIVLLMFCLSTLFCVPYWLKFKYTSDGGLHETELGKNPQFNRIVHFWMYLPIAYIIPFSILIITNLYLIKTLMTARQRRERLGMGLSVNTNMNKFGASSHHIGNMTTAANNPIAADETMRLNPPVDATTTTLTKNNNSLSVQRADSKKKSTDSSLKSSFKTSLNASNNNNSSKRRSNAQIRTNAHGRNITIMLVAVVCFFFTCQFPVLILHIITSMNTLDKNSTFYQYGFAVSKFLLVTNLSFNFACYCLFSKKFRSVFKETFLKIKTLQQ